MTRLFLATAVLLACAACDHGDGGTAEPGFSARPTPLPLFDPTIAHEDDAVLAPVALAPTYFTVVSGPLESEDATPHLRVEPLDGGAGRTIADDIVPSFGIATFAGRIVYAANKEGAPPELVTVDLGGENRQVVSSSLLAPIASRGRLIAWAEQVDDRQRVVVRDLGDGREWVADDLPRCEGGCFRIDAVTLADDGVVFVRGAIGPHPSFVVRRAFSSSASERTEIAGDPQPDIVPSSHGALYYALRKGWYRWDFGQAEPKQVPFPGPQTPTVLRLEGDRWFLLEQNGCGQGVSSRTDAGKTSTVVSPATLPAEAGVERDSCVQLADLLWTGRQLVSSWIVVPKESEEGHEDVGLSGTIVASP